MLTITGAYLYGYQPGNESANPGDADYAIPSQDIESVEISMRAGELKDSASITLDNFRGKYSGIVDHGHRLTFYVSGGAVDGDGDNRWGRMSYGGGSYSTGYLHEWTGLVGPYKNSAEGASHHSLSITAEDFVYSLLGDRRHWGRYEGAPIAGTSDAILNQVLEAEVPEIDRSAIDTIDETTDFKSNGMTVLDILKELMRRGDFTCAAQDTKLVVNALDQLTTVFETGPNVGDFGPPTFNSNDDDLYNRIRVVGGTDTDEDDTQTAQSGYATVTESNRLIVPINPETARIDLVEVWTRTTGSEDSVIVRVQRDDGSGNPVDPNNSKLDLTKKELTHYFLDDDGYTTFDLPSDYFIPGQTAHLIIESSGTDGQDIGVNASGVPAFIAYFPYPVDIQTSNPDSIDQFRRRDKKVTDDSLSSFESAEATGDGMLTQQSTPERSLSAPVYSERAHALRTLDVVRVDGSMLDVHDDFIVLEKADEYSGSTLKSSVSMQSLDSL